MTETSEGGAHVAKYVQYVWESPLQFCSMLMGKLVRAHRPKRVHNYEWAHDRPMASAANTNKWAHGRCC